MATRGILFSCNDADYGVHIIQLYVFNMDMNSFFSFSVVVTYLFWTQIVISTGSKSLGLYFYAGEWKPSSAEKQNPVGTNVTRDCFCSTIYISLHTRFVPSPLVQTFLQLFCRFLPWFIFSPWFCVFVFVCFRSKTDFLMLVLHDWLYRFFFILTQGYDENLNVPLKTMLLISVEPPYINFF